MKYLLDLLKKEFEYNSKKDETFLDYNGNLKELKKENFKEIKEITSKDFSELVFIDGGNANLVSNGAICIDYIKIASVLVNFNGNKSKSNLNMNSLKKEIKINDYILVSKSRNNEFVSNLYSLKEQKLIKNYLINPNDESLRFGLEEMPIENISNIIRKNLEFEQILNYNNENILFVMDGSIEAKNSYNEKEINNVFNNIVKKNQSIVGVSKSTNLRTKDDESISSFLYRIGLKKQYILASVLNKIDKEINIFFSSFSKNNKILRVDYLNNNFLDIDDVMSILMILSKDSSFKGYPYPLVLVDQLARVSNNEIFSMKSFLKSKLKSFEDLIEESNSHDVLDNMRF